jgi:glucosyl-dolichyl phosphate glucuronosyltransferase
MRHTSCQVSIVLGTYNRCALLGPAIERLLDQSPSSPPYELVVVDNNSTDSTRSVVEGYMARAGGRLQYVFEPRQGLSHARNAGIAAAKASIVAFTDDDVRVASDWVGVIARTFQAHPDVDCLGGRTLPVWPSPPPAWLTPSHWVGPLALQDYGDRSFILDARRPLCLAGANFAFRKRAFDRVGLFSADFPRSEDTELMLRLWLSGARALYVPDMMVYAAVQPERLEKAYHRSWHMNIGRCNARMKLEERSDREVGLRPTLPEFGRVMGMPLFAVRQLIVEIGKWLLQAVRRRPAEAFLHETRARALVGYMSESRRIYRWSRRPTAAAQDAGQLDARDPSMSAAVER